MVTYGRLQDNIANCKLQNSLYLITFKTLGVRDLSQKYMGDKNFSSKGGGGCAWVFWHCILGIWETANIWYFDIVFWRFEMIDHRGGGGGGGLESFDIVFWGFGKLQTFGILTLYFGDLRWAIIEGGGGWASVFWHCILGIWETANLWSFDIVFWGFEVTDQRGGLGFLGICGILGIWETASLWYFDFVFWGFEVIDHLEGPWFFGDLWYFGDLGNCKSLVFWLCILKIWETANVWYFDFVFWGFGKLQIFGNLILYFGILC